MSRPNVSPLYDRPVQASRSGAVYNAFSYPTKIDAEAVAVFVAAHTDPGDTVLDVFGGSGTTGVAARLCDAPTTRMRALAADMGLAAKWGPRSAVLYELSPVGALLSSVICDPPDPDEFDRAATGLCARAERAFGWAYEASAPDGSEGQLRHTIWSEVLVPPCCGARVTLFDAVVKMDPVVLHDKFRCSDCGGTVTVGSCSRAVIEREDPVTGEAVRERERVTARVYGRSGTRTWSRLPTDDDRRLVEKVEGTTIGWVPSQQIFWGDLHRSGYHTGIERYHHLYTPRNLRAVAALWAEIDQSPERLRDALRLLVLSYNATHSTLLTRVVAKRDQPDFVVTGAQSGVLYVSGLPVEKNVFEGVRRKAKTFREAFSMALTSRSHVRVVCGSSTSLDIADDSVDYVFTDPPFGDFIPYAEVNQVNEAWLGRFTDRTDEAIISPAQGKGVTHYARLMTEVFGEVARVLHPAGRATVVFHASKPAVWQAVGDAFGDNGLAVDRTSVLDKTQVSFKQVVSAGGTRGDAVFLLRHGAETGAKPIGPQHVDSKELAKVIAAIQAIAGTSEQELSPKRLYSRYVARCVEAGTRVAISAPGFYEFLANLPVAEAGTQAKSGGASRDPR